MKNVKLYFKEVLGFDRKVLFLLGLNVIFALIVLVITSILPAFIVSYLTQSGSVQALAIPLALLIALIVLINYFLMNVSGKFRADIIGVRVLSYSSRMVQKFLTMDYDLVESDHLKKTYDKATSNFVASNRAGAEAILEESKNLLVNLFAFTIFGFLLGSFNPLAFVLVFIVAIVRYYSLKRARNFRKDHKQEWSDLDSKRRHLKLESLKVENGKDMRLYEAQGLYGSKLDALTQRRMDWHKKEYGIDFQNRLLSSVAVLLRDGFVFMYLVNAVLKGMDLAEFTLFFTLMSSFNVWIQAILDSSHAISLGFQDYHDFQDYMDYDRDRKHASALVQREDTYEIEFVNVSYRYPNQDTDTVSNLNLKMAGGEKLALVGINGAGKSTIVKLMMGLIKPSSGEILLNGQSIADYQKVDYYDLFAPVFQEDDVWALTLAQNVAMNRETYDEARVVELVEKVGLGDSFKDVNVNLTRHLYQDGRELSGGETQKLMLARALYKDAAILVLDEPTAALDALAEANLYEQYESFAQGKSALFISHRLSSTKFCNRIIYLENGQIIESGTHDDLLAMGGKYAEMFAVQSQYYKEALA